jgi:hypothetical protein
LIRPWPPADKYPKPSRIVMARHRGQLELPTAEAETGGDSIAIAFNGRLLVGLVEAREAGGVTGRCKPGGAFAQDGLFPSTSALCVPKIRFGVDAASGRRKLAS